MRRAEFHEAEGRHQGELAKSNRRDATTLRAMHKAQVADGGESMHGQLADECDKRADMHEAHQAFHSECAKAAHAADLAKAVPTNVSAVAPDAPGIRAVPRAGQRPIEEAKPQVEAQFAKLVAVDEGENEPASI